MRIIKRETWGVSFIMKEYFKTETMKDNISDVESQMYAPPGRVREYLENEPKKPFILCEYMHDMGNSLGGMKSYIDLLDQYEKYQGGFIWDYIDQALLVKDEITGREVLRYGEILMTVRRIMNFRETESYLQIEQKNRQCRR